MPVLLVALLSLVSMLCTWPGIGRTDDVAERWEFRRLYVPVESLHAVMKQDRYGAVLSRAEFDALVSTARERDQATSSQPRQAVISAADSQARVEGERLVNQVTIQLRTFAEQGSEVSWRIAGWNIEQAQLNGEPARLTRSGDDLETLAVFVPTAGDQRLSLTFSCPLRAIGSDKVAAFDLPAAPSGRFSLSLPEGQFLKVNGATIEPTIEEAGAQRTFSLPVGGTPRLELILTDRQQATRADLLTFASTAYGVNVLPGEITWTARTELTVFGRDLDSLVCRVPNTLEITGVESTGLESWELSDAAEHPGQTTIELQYRQPFSGQRTITFRGVVSAPTGEAWPVPNLVLSNVSSHVGVVAIQHPDNVRLQPVEASGVRPLERGQVPSVITASGGLRPPLAYQVWAEEFVLRFVSELKEQQVQAAMTTILDVGQTELNLSIVLGLRTRLAPLFDARIRLPAEWQMSAVTVDGQPVPWERVPDVAGIDEIRIPLNPPLLPGQQRAVALAARLQPEGFPVETTPVRIAIPEIRLPQAAMVEALYGVSGAEDLELLPVELTGLEPARQQELDQLNARIPDADRKVRLGFNYQDTVFRGQLEISRKPAQLAVQTLTFFRIGEETLTTRLEGILKVGGGGLRELDIRVSESAGDGLRFSLRPRDARTLPVRIIEQTSGEPAEGTRPWTLRLDRHMQGQYLLLTEVHADLTESNAEATAAVESLRPPRLVFPQAETQHGYVAVETRPEDFVRITATGTDGQPLDLVDPVDFPRSSVAPLDPRLSSLAPGRVVAGYRHVSPDWTLTVSRTRFDRSAVPIAIGHLASLASVLSESGDLQHQAEITFTAVGAQGLLIRLPRETELWSTLVDGVPVESRRAAEGVHVPLAGLDPQARHTLRLLYATSAPRSTALDESADDSTNGRDPVHGPLKTELATTPPEISIVAGDGRLEPLEILKHQWQLSYPRGTVLLESDGPFRPQRDLGPGTIFSRLRERLRLPTAEGLTGQLVAIAAAVLILVFLGWVRRRTREQGWVMSTVATLAAVGIVGVLLLAWLTPSVQQARRAPVLYVDDGTRGALEAPSDEWIANEMSAGSDIPFNLELGMDKSREERKATNGIAPPTSEPIDQAASRRRLYREEDKRAPAAAASPARPGMDQQLRDGNTFSGAAPPSPASPPTAEPQSAVSENRNGVMSGPAVQPGEPALPQLGLQVQQSRTIEETPDVAIAGEMAKLRLAGIAGGLLSMTFDLPVPEGARTETFEYRGNGLAADELTLRVRVADRTREDMLVWTIGLGVLLIGWWWRLSRRREQGGAVSFSSIVWLFLTIVLPLALVGIVPVLWQFLLEGVLLGGVGSLFSWLIADCLQRCGNCCQRTTATQRHQVGGSSRIGSGTARKVTQSSLLMAVLGTVLISSTQADESSSTAKPAVPATQPFVVVPYRSLEELPTADRVWVPHETYKRLWSTAHPEQVEPTGLAVDRPASIAEATYLTRLAEGDSGHVAVQARWVIAVFKDAAEQVVLPVEQVAFENLTVNGNPGALRSLPRAESSKQDPKSAESGDVAVVLPGRGLHIVDATFRVAASAKPTFGEFRLQLHPVGAGILTFELPSSETSRRFRVNGATGGYRRRPIENADDPARIEIPIDRGGNIIVNWQPETMLADLDNIVHVETDLTTRLDDTGLQTEHQFLVQVRQGGVQDLSFDLPEDVSVREVSGTDVGGWELNLEEGRRQLRVFLRRTVSATGDRGQQETRLKISLFRGLSIPPAGSDVAIPFLTPRNVTRETGRIVLMAPEYLRVRVVEAAGAQQIDAGQFGTPQERPLFAYRFSSRPLTLGINVVRREAESRATIEHGVHIGRRKLLIASRIVLNLTGAPVRQLDVELPSGYLVVDVVCPQSIDWFLTSHEGTPRLTLELDQPRTGQVEIGLEGHVVKEPDDDPLTITLPQPLKVERKSSALGIWLDEAYQSTIQSIGNWRSIPPEQLPASLRRLQSRPARFGFTSTADSPEPITLRLTRATPELQGDAVTLIAASDATLDYGFTLRWKIVHAAADEFSFTVPDWLGRLEITGPGIRQVQSIAEDGRRRWTVSLVDPVREDYLLSAAATIPLPADRLVRTPMIEFVQAQAAGDAIPLDVQRRYAILVNLSGSQLVPADVEQFESVAADELPLSVPDDLVRQAMEIVRVRSGKVPQWRLERMETLTGTQAVVLTATLTTVLEMDGSWRTRVNYAVRNRGRQFLAVDIPAGARLLSVFVRGEPSRTVVGRLKDAGQEAGDQSSPSSLGPRPETQLIALPQTSAADLSFDIDLILEGRLPRPLPESFAAQRIPLPAPQVIGQKDSAEFGLPVAQTLWTVHFPKELDVAHLPGVKHTNLTPHDHDRGWLAQERQTFERLKADMAEMQRVLASKGTSSVQRAQARSNLKQIGLALQSNSQEAEIWRYQLEGRSASEIDAYLSENRKLQEQALQSAAEPVEQSEALDSPQLRFEDGRSFIIQNNDMLIIGNSFRGAELQRDQSIDSLNFYGLDDSRRAGQAGKAEKEQLDRSQLRQQLSQQAPLVQKKQDLKSETKPFGGMGGLGGGGSGFRHPNDARERALPESASPLAADMDELHASDVAEVRPMSRTWLSRGGLSVQMEMPVSGEQLTFSKVGGQPELTLSVRPRQSWSLIVGAVWCVVVLGLGVWLLRQGTGGTVSLAGLIHAFAVLAVLLGLTGFLLLPMELRWASFTLFCMGGLVLAFQTPRTVGVKTSRPAG